MEEYLVTYEAKARESSEWYCVILGPMPKQVALDQYNARLPGPNGSFGPIEYSNIRLSRVVKEHAE